LIATKIDRYVRGLITTLYHKPGQTHYAAKNAQIQLVVNSEEFPCRPDVTAEFQAYVRPLTGDNWPLISLINGCQRFAHLEPIFAEKKLPDHFNQEDQSK
jgi:hypothetical protein